MRALFLDIDTQIDFISPRGALYVPGAEKLTGLYEKLSALAIEKGITVLASADAHRLHDPEFEQFPAHCIKGHKGQEKIPETYPSKFIVEKNDGAEVDPENLRRSHILFEKQTFDVFSNPKIDKYLQVLKPDKIIVYGVATDYCIQAAVRSLLSRRYHVWLVQDAIKAVNPKSEADILRSLQASGLHLISFKDLPAIL